MANVRNQNTFYVDSTSSSSTPGSWVSLAGIKVSAVVLSGSGSITINDLNSAGNGAGNTKLVLSAAAGQSAFFNFYECNMSFANGIWISAISGTATIITSNTG